MKKKTLPLPALRPGLLIDIRNLKMARSANAYVRGNTQKFYEALSALPNQAIPEGPPIWICGDCHVGNLGPLANARGHVEIQIRDLDQTVIGNPAHDLIRLGLSLASAARGSDLPGVTTAQMLEQMIVGYEAAFDDEANAAENDDTERKSSSRQDKANQKASKSIVKSPATADNIKLVLKQAKQRTWVHLANERIEGIRPEIPLGKRFWPLSEEERDALKRLFEKASVASLATALRQRDTDARVEVLDAAYWVKGCSSLGGLRYAVLLDIGGGTSSGRELCLMDIKEAVKAVAPRYSSNAMPRDNAQRVVTGARQLAPFLGERMLAERLLDRSVFMRELLPQDLKIELDALSHEEAMKSAYFLALVVGKAHARQMDAATRHSWQTELKRNRSKKLDAPSWLWNSMVELILVHERGYLEHCRRYALDVAQR
jgi:uncharacterized protein (DUF2252 family)